MGMTFDLYDQQRFPFLLFCFLVVTLLCEVTSCPLQCQCYSKYYVYCSDGSISDDVINDVVSGVSSSAKLLDLSANQISRISPRLFTRVPNLEHLDISVNRISELASRTFQNLTKLREFRISKNKIRSLDEDVFFGLRNVKDIQLSENLISHLPAGTFSQMAALEKIGLANNQIKSLEPKSFSGLKFLNTLDLGNNGLAYIEGYTFSGLHLLRNLTLNGNSLSKFHKEGFRGLNQLEHLDVSGNNIKDLSFVYGNSFYKSLTSLDVSHNAVTFVPDVVIPCNLEIKNIDLSSNRIREIARYAFQKLKLETLNLSRNSMLGIDRYMFRDAREIFNLDLSHNKISDIKTGAFDSFRDFVFFLNLRGNSLDYIHTEMFRGMSRLRTINLSENKISSIDDHSFRDSVLLEELDLSGNLLVHVSANIVQGPEDLRYLRLTRNPIRELSEFRFDAEESSANQRLAIEVNGSVESSSPTGTVVSWPFRRGSQLYWTISVTCLRSNQSSCFIPPYVESLRSQSQQVTLTGLESGEEYFVCVNPAFLSPNAKVTQCTRVLTQHAQADGQVNAQHGKERDIPNSAGISTNLCFLGLSASLVISLLL